ncbi:MAG: hypothetical protein U0Z75_08000 [Deinococcaceae bacterium]
MPFTPTSPHAKNGRKHPIAVDTLGLLLHVNVLAANIADREGGKILLAELKKKNARMKLHVLADGG